MPKPQPANEAQLWQKNSEHSICWMPSSLFRNQEQTSDDTTVMLNGFGTVVNSLGPRVKPYLPQIAGIIRP